MNLLVSFHFTSIIECCQCHSVKQRSLLVYSALERHSYPYIKAFFLKKGIYFFFISIQFLVINSVVTLYSLSEKYWHIKNPVKLSNYFHRLISSKTLHSRKNSTCNYFSGHGTHDVTVKMESEVCVVGSFHWSSDVETPVEHFE